MTGDELGAAIYAASFLGIWLALRLGNQRQRLACAVLGHQPRGPMKGIPRDIYRCERCGRAIAFDADRGWLLWP